MLITRVVAEADEIIYRAAASCEKTCHIVHFKDGRQVDLVNEYTMTELRKFYKDQGFNENIDYTVEIYKSYAGLNTLINNLQAMIDTLWRLGQNDVAKKFNIGEINNLEFWLSNANRQINFRYDIAKTEGKKGLGYKAGRGEKPKYIKEARDYIIDMFGAKETTFGEADDAIAIRQSKDSILSSIDKDLLMIPGLHYNWYYDHIFYVPEGLGGSMMLGKNKKPYGLLCFYTQLLCGDDIDNIPGCFNPDKSHHKNPPKFSMEYALNYLQQCEEENEESYFNTVALVYQADYRDNWVNVLMEVADLIWICRDRNLTGSQYLKARGFL